MLIFLLACLSFIYKDVIFQDKIVFPSNLLASFYSPWATYKFPGWSAGTPNKPIGGNDQVRMFYPYRNFINESFARREFPLWNPYNFSGSPLIADFQSAVFYPPNLLYFFLPQITAWSLLVVIQPLLGTLFMYLYLRQFITQKLAAFLGAFAFGFSGFILTWSQENAVVGQASLWFPVILYSAEKFISNFKLKYFILLVFSLSSCILAGFLQTAFYIFFVSFWYGIFRIMQIRQDKRLVIFLFFLASFLLTFLICAIQLLPSIEAFRESPRSSVSARPVIETYLLPLTDYIKVFAPDIFGNPGAYNYFGRGFYHESVFYIGIIPLVFAVLAFFKRRKDPVVRFYILLALASFFLGVKSFFTQWLYSLPIPLTSTFTPSRIFFVASFALAVLSAFGFSYWLKTGTAKLKKILYTTIAVIALILLSFFCLNFFPVILGNNAVYRTISAILNIHATMLIPSLKIAVRNTLLPLFMLFSLVPLTLLQKRIKIAPIFIILIFCLGQFYFLNKYVVVGSKEFLYPDHFIFSDIQKNQNMADRFLSFGLPILGDVTLDKHVYSPDGIDPVFPGRYGQLIFAAKNAGVFTKEIPRIEANLSEYAENMDIINNFRRLRLMSLLGVTRIYNYEKDYKDPKTITEIFPPDIFTPVWKRDYWQAYENKKAFPRVFLADNYLIMKDPQKIMDLIFDKNINLAKTVILEEKPDNFTAVVNNNSTGVPPKTSLQIYRPQYIQIQTESETDRILILTDNYYPGWKAGIDGIPTKIYRADYTFRAIVVPQGKHTVTFSFAPLSFYIGSIISLTTLLLIIFYFFLIM